MASFTLAFIGRGSSFGYFSCQDGDKLAVGKALCYVFRKRLFGARGELRGVAGQDGNWTSFCRW